MIGRRKGKEGGKGGRRNERVARIGKRGGLMIFKNVNSTADSRMFAAL